MQNLKYVIQELNNSFLNYKTDTLVFRPFMKTDIFPLYEASKDENFNTKLAWQCENFDEFMVQGLKLLREQTLNLSLVISACEKNTGKWAGVIKFSILKDSLTMSLWMHPDQWKSRNPIRCAESSIDIIFKNSNLPHIYAIIAKDFPTMEKMVLSNNFALLEQSTIEHSKGHIFPTNIFKLHRENWTRPTKIETY